MMRRVWVLLLIACVDVDAGCEQVFAAAHDAGVRAAWDCLPAGEPTCWASTPDALELCAECWAAGFDAGIYDAGVDNVECPEVTR